MLAKRFCVDGTARKLFPKAIQSLSRATAMWKTVSVIAVITKSYSIKERRENIEMVQNAFASEKKYAKNLKKIIPVVASIFELNDTAYAPPEGITELIDATNELMPEGLQAGTHDLAEFKLSRKRYSAHGIVGVATASGVAIGAVPTSFSDVLLLAPVEVTEINAIAKIYGIKNDDKSKKLFDSIVDVGTVSVVAKTAIAALKNIPGIHIGAGILNAIIAGSIVAALGEGTTYIFEQIYLGNKTYEDIDWVTKVLEDKLAMEFIESVKKMIVDIGAEIDVKDVSKLIIGMLAKK